MGPAEMLAAAKELVTSAVVAGTPVCEKVADADDDDV